MLANARITSSYNTTIIGIVYAPEVEDECGSPFTDIDEKPEHSKIKLISTYVWYIAVYI